MKVLLTEFIDKLGDVGDVVDVKSGFARNFLFPKKLAIDVTPHNRALMEREKKKIEKRIETETLSAQEQKQKLELLSIAIKKKAGENDVLFGSVTPTEIEKELEHLGVQVDKKKIHLDEPIKRLGHYTCKIKLFKDIEAEIKIEVRREEEAASE